MKDSDINTGYFVQGSDILDASRHTGYYLSGGRILRGSADTGYYVTGGIVYRDPSLIRASGFRLGSFGGLIGDCRLCPTERAHDWALWTADGVNGHSQKRFLRCPDCGCRIRVGRFDKHRRKVHGWQAAVEKKAAPQPAKIENCAPSSLGKRVREEARRFALKQRFAAALYRMSQPQRHRHPSRPPKKARRGPWPGPDGIQSGRPPLIYSGAFEMNRRRH